GHFLLTPDFAPYWVGHSYSGVVLPLDDEPTLVLDIPDWRRDVVPMADVRFSINFPEAVGRALADRGLAGAPVGPVGENALVGSTYRQLVAAAGTTELVEADDLIEDLRLIKSPFELERVREAAEVGNAVVDAIVRAALVPGTTEAEAVAAGYAIGIAR